MTKEKPVIWFPDNVRKEIKDEWPTEIKRDIGFQLSKVQQGMNPDNFREMPSVGEGVREIKIQDEDKSQYRLIYVAKFSEGIYAFHAITKKKTQKTSDNDIKLAKKRLKEIVEKRKEAKRDV